MISRKELFAEISSEAVTEDGEVVGYFVKNSRMNLLEQMLSGTVTVKLPYTPEPRAFAPWAAKAFYQFHKDTVKSCAEAFSEACSAAGVKLEIK